MRVSISFYYHFLVSLWIFALKIIYHQSLVFFSILVAASGGKRYTRLRNEWLSSGWRSHPWLINIIRFKKKEIIEILRRMKYHILRLLEGKNSRKNSTKTKWISVNLMPGWKIRSEHLWKKILTFALARPEPELELENKSDNFLPAMATFVLGDLVLHIMFHRGGCVQVRLSFLLWLI